MSLVKNSFTIIETLLSIIIFSAIVGTFFKILTIKENKTVHKVALDSIIYAEAAGDYVKVISENQSMLTHSTFSKFIEHLPPQFLRVHKSFCVNTDKITKLSGNQIHLSSYNLPIGQTYKTSVLNALNV